MKIYSLSYKAKLLIYFIITWRRYLNTYFFVEILSSINTNNLCSCFMKMHNLGVVNEFSFHNWLEFNTGRLIDSLWEWLSWWCETCLAICLTEYIFALNAWYITTVTWNLLSRECWLLNVFASVKLLWFMTGVAWNGVFVVRNEHIYFIM